MSPAPDVPLGSSLSGFLVVARDAFARAEYRTCVEDLEIALRNGDEGGGIRALAARAYLRLGRPDRALEIASAASDLMDPDDRVETYGVLAFTRACCGDVDGATAALAAGRITAKQVSPWVSGEFAFSAALVAWAREDYGAVERALREDVRDDPVSVGRREMIRAFTAARRGDTAGYGRFALSAARHLSSTSPGDLGQLATAVRALAFLARELPPTEPYYDAARELAARMPWTVDLARDQMQVNSRLAIAHALRGNAVLALRAAHEAHRLAPSQAWRAAALFERARIKRAISETHSAREDLTDALEAIRFPNWHQTDDEERLVLLDAAEMIADDDAPRAENLLSHFASLVGSIGAAQTYRAGPYLPAHRALATGIVRAATGQGKVAERELRAAFDTYTAIGFHARAARAAASLARLTGDSAWREKAMALATTYPEASLLVAELRDVLRDEGDGLRRLSPRRRDVFWALCEGRDFDAIARSLRISRHTARNHAHAVYKAFGVSSQAALITEARRRHLI